MAIVNPALVKDIDEDQLEVTPHKEASAGVPAVAVTMERGVRSMGVSRTARTLRRIDQVGEWADHMRTLDWDAVGTATGLRRTQIEEVGDLLPASSATVTLQTMSTSERR